MERIYKIHNTRELKLPLAIAEHAKNFSAGIEGGLSLEEAIKRSPGVIGEKGWREAERYLYISLTDDLTDDTSPFESLLSLFDTDVVYSQEQLRIIHTAIHGVLEMIAMLERVSVDRLLYASYDDPRITS